MTTPPLSPTSARPTGAPGRPAGSPEEAARQFEAVLVRQFVEVMTKDLFDGEAEGGMTGQADLQRDTLTDTLTDHLVESGTFGVADLMIAQWKRSGRIAPDAETSLEPAAPPADAVETARPMTMDEALRLYPATQSSTPAKGRPVSNDHDHAPLP